MITINLLFVVTLLAGLVSLYDGIARLRGKRSNSILAIAEVVFAALLIVSLFVAFPAPLSLLTWAILLLIVLLLVLILRGTTSRGVWAVTIVAIILTAVVVLVNLGWLNIPGLF